MVGMGSQQRAKSCGPIAVVGEEWAARLKINGGPESAACGDVQEGLEV